MYNVKIYQHLTIKEIIIWILVLSILLFNLNVLTLNNYKFLTLVVVIIMGILECVRNNSTYVSEILIDPVYLKIVYCKRNKIIDIVKIKRTDISSFEVFAEVEERNDNIVQMKGNVSIKTNTQEEINFTMYSSNMDIKPSQIFSSTIQPLINIAKMQNKFKFKNFSYEIIGSKYAKLTMQHYIEHGNRSFLQALKTTLSTSSPIHALGLYTTIIGLGLGAIMIIFLLFSIYFPF